MKGRNYRAAGFHLHGAMTQLDVLRYIHPYCGTSILRLRACIDRGQAASVSVFAPNFLPQPDDDASMKRFFALAFVSEN
ncbi:hypothetical protein C7405_11685 [Paraburkholderia caballeronis]|nr:hypothetical protein C7405_11685 [Paraburkholderia caballeronis]